MSYEIYNEDCLEAMKRLGDNSVDCIICDPPYFNPTIHSYGAGTKQRLSNLSICQPFYREVFSEINRVLTDKGCLYWFCDWRSMGFFLAVMECQEIPVKNCLVWDKGGGAGNFYTYNHEMILFATFNKAFRCKNVKNVISGILGFTVKKNIDGGKIHPAQKPIALIEKLIKDSTMEKNIIVDLFMGSGTTAIAALNLNRQFIGFEIDEQYFDIAKKRIDEAIAKKAQSLF